MQLPQNHWLYQLKADLQKIEPSIQLILYGSRARGDARPDSDWDLLLLTEKSYVTHEIEDILRMPVTLMEVEVGEPFSLQIFTKYEWEHKFYITPYYHNIQKDGILI
jgi:uncharacterized protein